MGTIDIRILLIVGMLAMVWAVMKNAYTLLHMKRMIKINRELDCRIRSKMHEIAKCEMRIDRYYQAMVEMRLYNMGIREGYRVDGEGWFMPGDAPVISEASGSGSVESGCVGLSADHLIFDDMFCREKLAGRVMQDWVKDAFGRLDDDFKENLQKQKMDSYE